MKTNSITYNINNTKSMTVETAKPCQCKPLVPSFKGATVSPLERMGGALPWLMNKIENGGFVLEFFLLDLCGLVIPRTVQAFNRNKQELGGFNIIAGLEEFLRESLTGPSMFLIPLTALLLTGRMAGKGAQINVKTLRKFTEIFKKTATNITDTDALKMQKDFISGVFDNVFKKHAELATTPGKTAELAELKTKFTNIVLQGVGKEKKAAEFTNLVADINKRFTNPDNPLLVGFENVKKTKLDEMIDNTTGYFKKLFKKGNENEITKTAKTTETELYQIPASDLYKDIIKYASDIVPTTRETIKDLIAKKTAITKEVFDNSVESISKMREGARKLLTATGVLSVGSFLCIMPKIYQLSKSNPGVKGLEEKDGGVK